MPWPDLFNRREEDTPSSLPPSAPTVQPLRTHPPSTPLPISASSSSPSQQPHPPSTPVPTLSSTTSFPPATPLLTSPLKTSILSAILGLTFGSTSALIRHSPTPTLFALATSTQWGALGGTYTFVRNRGFLMAEERGRHGVGVRQAQGEAPFEVSAGEKARISAIAGAAAGAVGGALRGRVSNVLAGAGVFAGLGWMGQRVIDARAAKGSLPSTERVAGKAESDGENAGVVERMAKSKWNPMRKLTDEEYENMLREKLIRVEAEIAVVDEEIVGLERLRGREERE